MIIFFFFQFICLLQHFIIIRRYSRAYVVLVYSDFSGGWNHSACGLMNHKAPRAQQILVWHMSCRVSLLQHSPRTPPVSPVATHLTADGPLTSQPQIHPCSHLHLWKAQDIFLWVRLIPDYLQGCLNFVAGWLWGFSNSQQSLVGV